MILFNFSWSTQIENNDNRMKKLDFWYFEQAKQLTLWLFECKKPSHEAFVLGLAAASLLGAAHVLANLFGGCSVCSTDDIRKATPIKQLSIACLVFTW